MQGEISDPRAPLGGNFRPIQPLNGRTMRTNIFVSSGKVFYSKYHTSGIADKVLNVVIVNRKMIYSLFLGFKMSNNSQ